MKDEATTGADITHTMSLFGFIESTGIAIKNLNITGSITISSTSVYGTGGAVAGLACTLTSGIIENCTFTGNVEASFTHTRAGVYAAGLVFDIAEQGIVRNCTFSGTVRAYNQVHQQYGAAPIAGGIALHCSGVIENCKVLAGSIVSANGYMSSAGGITGGFSKTSSSRISGCTSNASIEDAEHKGGLIGVLYTGEGTLDNLNLFGNTFTGTEQAIGWLVGDNGEEESSDEIDPTHEFNSHKYRLFKESLTWKEAKEKCESMGGYLATITSKAESDFIKGFANEERSYWIGGTDEGSEGVWHWVTEEPFTFTNWNSGEPNNFNGNEHFLEFDGGGGNGLWNDTTNVPSDSEGGRYYICEWGDYTPVQTEETTLEVTMIERRAKTGDPLGLIDNAPPNFYAERMYPDDNIICSMDKEHYYDIRNKTVTETSIAELFKDKNKVSGYIKKGFTADGNTRLILRVLTNKPGKLQFSAPLVLCTFENLSRDRGESANVININTTALSSTEHQATAVMISPNDFLHISSFPKFSFDVLVKFTPNDGSTPISEHVPVELHAVPVVFIHGFGRETTVDNTFGDENARWGIRRRLLDAGFRVYPCNYDSKLGPMTVIPGVPLSDYATTPIFANFAEALNNFALDEDRIACTRVDVVAHSMGGLMTRRFIQDDAGYQNTIRSYKQGMIRRLITVGTPHEGSPYANWLLWNQFPLWTTRLNPADVALSFKLTEFRGLTYLLNFNGTDDALRNFAIGSKLFDILKEPSVPVYALHGKITGQKWEKPLREEYESKYMGALPLQFWLPVMEEFEHDLDALKEDFSDWFVHTEMYSKTQLRVVFGANEEDCDGCVASSSATSIFKDSSESFTGWRFWHSSICHQNETGDRVVQLLQGGENVFKTFTTSNTSTNAKAHESRSNVMATDDTLSADFFAVRFTISAETSFDSASAEGTLRVVTPGSIKVKAVSSEDINHRVFAAVNNNIGTMIYQLTSTDARTFEDNIDFNDDDSGFMSVFCISYASEDTFYISDTINLVIAPDQKKITGLNFPESLRHIITNVSSDVGISLFAQTSDGVKYNAASPELGTTWSVDDSSIARVTDEGRLLGFKEGATTITASNNGFSASIVVMVGPLLFEDSTPEPLPTPTPTPDPEPNPTPTPKPTPTPTPTPTPDPTPTPSPSPSPSPSPDPEPAPDPQPEPEPEPEAQPEPEPEPTPTPEPDYQPNIIIGRPRNISSLSDYELSILSNDRTIIAAVLPEAEVNVSGTYYFNNIRIHSDAPVNSEMFWNSFVENDLGQDNSYAVFFDSRDNEIFYVPKDRRIKVEAHLEEGTHYAPVITVTRHSESNNESGHEEEPSHEKSSGGGGGCDSIHAGIMMLLCVYVCLRKN